MKRRILKTTIIAAAVIVSGLLLYIYIPRHIYFEIPIYDALNSSGTPDKSFLTVDIRKHYRIFDRATFTGTVTIDGEEYIVKSNSRGGYGLPWFTDEYSPVLNLSNNERDAALYFYFDSDLKFLDFQMPTAQSSTGEDLYSSVNIVVRTTTYEKIYEQNLYALHDNSVEKQKYEIQCQWYGDLSSLDLTTKNRLL
mgnify:CR=1 FL=1